MGRWLPSMACAVVAGLAGALAACAPAHQAPWYERQEPVPRLATPLLWLAEDPAPEGGAFFLLGSVHIGTAQGLSLSRTVDAAFAQSEELVVEVDVSNVDAAVVERLTKRYSTLRAPTTLPDVVTPEAFEQIAGYFAERGVAVAKIEHFKPWFISTLILQLEFREAGYQSEQGVDRLFIEKAEGNMPIVALESLDSQLEMMDELPESVQEMLLRSVLERSGNFAQEARDMLDAWGSGDEQRLTRLVLAPLEEDPDLTVFYDRIFFERNASMASRLDEMAGDGLTRMVVVGAGHLVGDRGIPNLLAQRGYRVREVGRSAPQALAR